MSAGSDQESGAAGWRRGVLIAVVAAYVAGLATMVAFDRYGLIWKSSIVPGLIVAALLVGGFKSFVNDWAVFLAAVILFDFCRGLVYAVIGYLDLHVYLGYVIDWERWLCGGETGPQLLQGLRLRIPDPGPVDRLFVLVHASHFLFFLFFGFALWSERRGAFCQYTRAMIVLMYLGLGFYLLVPTVPPWMAAEQFHAIPELTHISALIYNFALPELVAAFDVNPIAAMPSLHAAFPTLCALLALQHFGRRGAAAMAYAAAVCVAIVYLGEHYIVDVLAGIALAVAVFVMTLRSRADEPAGAESSLDGRRIAWALALVGVAFGLGQLTLAVRAPLPVTRSFIMTELAGRGDRSEYLLGRVAYIHGDFQEAEAQLTRAMERLRLPADRHDAQMLLAISAYRLRDFPTAIAALEDLRRATDTSESLLLLASAYVESGAYEKGITLLEQGRFRFPGDPEPLYWLTRYAFLSGRVDRTRVRDVVEELRAFSSAKSEPLQRALLELLHDDGAPDSPKA